MAKLHASYLFPEINRRKKELLFRVPSAKIISLGIGDTTSPLTPFISAALQKAAAQLSTEKGYSGYGTHGGIHAPYIWARVKNKKSWDAFNELLEQKHIVTTPGVGFGPAGEGFLRFSPFGNRESVLEAVERMKS